MIRKTDRDLLLSYLEDTSNFRDGSADEIIFPSDENEVLEVLKEYSSREKPLTASGAGTGTVAARIPLEGGILATEKLNRILKVDRKSMTAAVQPGVSVKTLLDELAKNSNVQIPSLFPLPKSISRN